MTLHFPSKIFQALGFTQLFQIMPQIYSNIITGAFFLIHTLLSFNHISIERKEHDYVYVRINNRIRFLIHTVFNCITLCIYIYIYNVSLYHPWSNLE